MPLFHRLLVVDDEPDVRDILSALLDPHFEVITAHNGLDALLKLNRVEPDLIISDVMMPVMDGLELARKIRTFPGYETLPFIFVSAADQKEQIREGYLAGANIYMTKPFDADRVVRNINLCLKDIAPRAKKHSCDEIRRQDRELIAGTSPVPASASTEAIRKLIKTHVERFEEKKAGATPPAPTPTAPAPPAPAPATPPRPGAPAPTTSRVVPKPQIMPRALVVDDDDDILTYIALILKTGFEVVTAHDGLEALHKIAEIQPDFVVLDGMLPKISGWQLLDMLRAAPETAHLPVIFASARDRKIPVRPGTTEFLLKPFEERLFLQAVHRIIDAPTFHVRPKKVQLRELITDQRRKTEEAQEKVKSKTRASAYDAISRFLKENEDRDPFSFRGD